MTCGWLGLDWDGEPIIQTTRLPQHLAALERLGRGLDLPLLLLVQRYPSGRLCTPCRRGRAALSRHLP